MVVGRVLEDLPEQQRVLHQSTARDVQEVPQVQLPAERRLQAALQEVLHPQILLLLVQQGLGLHLVTAVWSVGVEAGQLQGDTCKEEENQGKSNQHLITSEYIENSLRGSFAPGMNKVFGL